MMTIDTLQTPDGISVFRQPAKLRQGHNHLAPQCHLLRISNFGALKNQMRLFED